MSVGDVKPGRCCTLGLEVSAMLELRIVRHARLGFRHGLTRHWAIERELQHADHLRKAF